MNAKRVYTKFYKNKYGLLSSEAHILIECLESMAAFLISACLILIVAYLIIIVAGLIVHPAPQNMAAYIIYFSFSLLPCSFFLAVASLLRFFDPYATAKKAKEDLEDTQMLWMLGIITMLASFIFLVSLRYSPSTVLHLLLLAGWLLLLSPPALAVTMLARKTV